MDETEERKRIYMDLNVMSIHKSPHIVKYYGSVIWNVSQNQANTIPAFEVPGEAVLERLLTSLP